MVRNGIGDILNAIFVFSESFLIILAGFLEVLFGAGQSVLTQWKVDLVIFTAKIEKFRSPQLGHQNKKMFGENGMRHRVLRQILGLYVFGISSKNSVDPILKIFRFLVRVS